MARIEKAPGASQRAKGLTEQQTVTQCYHTPTDGATTRQIFPDRGSKRAAAAAVLDHLPQISSTAVRTGWFTTTTSPSPSYTAHDLRATARVFRGGAA